MLTKKRVLIIFDENSKLVKTADVKVYPAGTVSPEVSAINNNDGTYTVELDPSVDTDIIAKEYDIWWDAVKKISNTSVFGDWEWRVEKSINTSPAVLTYVSLTDDDGDTLPTAIPKAFAVITSTKDIGLHISQTTTSAVTISEISGAVYNIADGVTVNLLIKGG